MGKAETAWTSGSFRRGVRSSAYRTRDRSRLSPGGLCPPAACDHGRERTAGGAVNPPSSSSIAVAGAGFVAGLSLVFILFFYVFSLAVQPIRAYVPAVAGVLVIAMALHVAGVIRLPYLSSEYRPMKTAPQGQGGGVAGGFLLGMGFASG